MTWLDTYINLIGETSEAPRAYHKWCGLCTIAWALDRHVWYDHKAFIVMPNLYVVLVGPSGTRKSVATDRAEDLFLASLPSLRRKLFAPKGTAERFISRLVHNQRTYGGDYGSLIIVAREFATLIGVAKQDYGIIDNLTNAYDGRRVGNETKRDGIEECRRVCVNLLAGATPDSIRRSLTEHCLHSGFAARIVFVYEHKPARRIAFPELLEQAANRLITSPELQDGLVRMDKLRGEFQFDAEGAAWYEEWYEQTALAEERALEVNIEGYISRRHILLEKLAMLHSAARGDDMTLTLDDLSFGHDTLMDVDANLSHTVSTVGESEEMREIDRVRYTLRRGGEMTKSELHWTLSPRIPARRLNLHLQELVELNEVSVTALPTGALKYYYKVMANNGRNGHLC